MTTSDHVRYLQAGETRNVKIDYTDKLDSGELLTGTPTITEVTSSDLTLANKAVSTAQLTINGATVAIGAAVQFNVTGGTAGTEYKVKIIATSDDSVAQTFTDYVTLVYLETPT